MRHAHSGVDLGQCWGSPLNKSRSDGGIALAAIAFGRCAHSPAGAHDGRALARAKFSDSATPDRNPRSTQPQRRTSACARGPTGPPGRSIHRHTAGSRRRHPLGEGPDRGRSSGPRNEGPAVQHRAPVCGRQQYRRSSPCRIDRSSSRRKKLDGRDLPGSAQEAPVDAPHRRSVAESAVAPAGHTNSVPQNRFAQQWSSTSVPGTRRACPSGSRSGCSAAASR